MRQATPPRSGPGLINATKTEGASIFRSISVKNNVTNGIIRCLIVVVVAFSRLKLFSPSHTQTMR